MSDTRSKSQRGPIKRRIFVVLCVLAVPFMFNQMDQVYVVPQRLKQLIRVLDVETTMDEAWWRARIRITHHGFQLCDVELTLKWQDEHGEEIGRSQSIRAMSPGDTVIVRMAVKAVEGKQAVKHHLDYRVRSLP